MALQPTFEIEKVCVATETMSFQSYLNCRRYSFVVHLIGHAVFSPVFKLTKKIGIKWYDFSRLVNDALQNKNFKGKFKDVYEDFCRETVNELFESENDAIEFYSKPENFVYSIYEKQRYHGTEWNFNKIIIRLRILAEGTKECAIGILYQNNKYEEKLQEKDLEKF